LGKIKEIVMEICEAYDYEGLTIMELANRFEMTEAAIIEVLSNYSETFGVV
jgi:transposase